MGNDVYLLYLGRLFGKCNYDKFGNATHTRKLDGIGFWRELWSIRIPLIMPTVSVFLLNSVMCVANFFLVPMTFMTVKGPEGRFDTFPWLMLRLVEENGLDPSVMITVSTIGFIFSLILLPFIILTKVITDKITPDVSF